MELIEILSRNLGLHQEQVTGGAGLLFRIAKLKLRYEEFSKVAYFVPNVDEMIRAAPKIGRSSSFAGLGSAIGGEISAHWNLANLTNEFSVLGFDNSKIAGLVDFILKDLRSRGGEAIKALLEKALK